MIKIFNSTEKIQKNFWNGCVFHPTDAVEDAWGKRILDKMAEDNTIATVRIYTMLEDIVYVDENGALQYDFRVSDLRLDYLIEKGYDLLLTYGGVPDCIAKTCLEKTSVSKGKTRYKGKLWNTSPPKSAEVWEEVCYQYTLHIFERYGLEKMKNWYFQCFNEPDNKWFLLSQLPVNAEATKARCEAYCAMYEGFVRGVRRVSKEIKIGGPTLAAHLDFLEDFLRFVKDKGLDLDFISVHNYGTGSRELNLGTGKICVQNNLENHKKQVEVIKNCGFAHLPLLIDEWGMSTEGFFNKMECPALMCRETEVFSSYFAKLIYQFVYSDFKVEKLMICLSGQHEMVEDFSGFRNFFTLNFIQKPIYNAFVFAGKLGENILKQSEKKENLFVLPTKKSNGSFAVLVSYSSENFEENLPILEETISFEEDISDKNAVIWCIDKQTTNPYRLFEKLGVETPNEAQIKSLQQEGILKPVAIKSGEKEINLRLTPNATYLIEIQ